MLKNLFTTRGLIVIGAILFSFGNISGAWVHSKFVNAAEAKELRRELKRERENLMALELLNLELRRQADATEEVLTNIRDDLRKSQEGIINVEADFCLDAPIHPDILRILLTSDE